MSKSGLLHRWAHDGMVTTENQAAGDDVKNGELREFDPREQCLLDFKKRTKTAMKAGECIIVLAGTNQTLQEETSDYSLQKLTVDCRMTSVMEKTFPNKTLWSVHGGTKMIDHILIVNVDGGSVNKAGKLPFSLGFSTYHRGIYADFKAENF